VESPLIDYVAAVGDGRRYVTAIIALDHAQVRRFARDSGLTDAFPAIAHHPVIQHEIATAVARGNKKLSRVERVRQWRVVDDQWVTGGDLVTGSMKLMRPRVVSRYGDLVEAMYQEVDGPLT
jgi:long-chain acyl-CoA synthetase